MHECQAYSLPLIFGILGAIAWANVDAEGAPNPRSLHEGMPPAPGEEKVAINVWIADRTFSSEELGKAYKT